MANVEEQIIPVRLDLEWEHHKLKDTFMWNCAGMYLFLCWRPLDLSNTDIRHRCDP